MHQNLGDLKKIKEIFKYFMKLKKYIFISAMIMILYSLITLPIPFINQLIVDKVIINREYEIMQYIIPVWILIIVIAPILNSVKSYFISLFDMKLDMLIRYDVFKKILHLPISYFEKNNVGYIQNRIETDIKSLHAVTAGKMIDMMNKLVLLVFGLIMLFHISWKLTLCVLVVLPIVIINGYFFSDKVKNYNKKVSEAWSELGGSITQNMLGIEIIKLFTMEKNVSENLSNLNKKCIKITGNKVKLDLTSNVIRNIFTGLESLIIWTYGSVLIKNNMLTLGQVVAFIGYSSYVYGPALQLANFKLNIQPVIAAWERIREILCLEDESYKEQEKPQIKLTSGKIEFNNVKFSYDSEKNVINNLNFVIHEQEKVIIIGHNGSGKSTLIKLLSQLYNQYSGKILIDNKNIKEYNIYSLRKQIAVVSQNIYLFSGSVIDNIKIAAPHLNDDEIKRFLSKNHLDELILKLPKGFDTIITENGSNLSGGQKQYISILRAIIKQDSKILIFDEATASLDTNVEYQLIKALKPLIKNKTFIHITHKKYNDYMERFLCLQNGSITELKEV